MADQREIAAVSAYIDAETTSADQREIAAVSAYIDAETTSADQREIAAVSAYICEVEPVASALVTCNVAFTAPDGLVIARAGSPVTGDRSVWNVTDYATLHAQDIAEAIPTYHLPTDSRTIGDVAKWDGEKWVNDPKNVFDGTIYVEAVQFDLVPTVTPSEGLLYWNEDDGTLNLALPGGNAVNQIGQEVSIRATNAQGATIANGRAVIMTTSSGNFPSVILADKSSIATAGAIGIATEDILDKQKGYITNFGLVRDIDTSGIASGSVVWLGDNGEFLSTRPTAPDISTLLGVVVRSHAAVGSLFVAIQTVPRLQGLSDVEISGIADGDLVVWSGTNARFENETVSAALDAIYARLDLDNQPFVAAVDSVTAFQIQANDTTPIFNVDTTNGKVAAYGQLLVDGKADEVQNIIQAHSTQTANLTEWQDSGGNVLANVTGVGNFQTQKGRIVNTTRVTTTYTALVTDHMIFCNTDGGSFTVTLPAGVEGQEFRIANTGSNVLTIDGNGAETVHGNLTQDLYSGEVLILIYNSMEGWF